MVVSGMVVVVVWMVCLRVATTKVEQKERQPLLSYWISSLPTMLPTMHVFHSAFVLISVKEAEEHVQSQLAW